MPSRIVLLLFVCFLLPAASQTQAPLVEYHFDDEQLVSGPDTFLIVQSTKGSVHLSDLYRYSGIRSLEIRSIAGDPDFPELQGYFPLQEKGTLLIRFAFLVTNPPEPINIALAGPGHFRQKKNGLALWLKTEGGVLQHVTDQKTVPLLALRPFRWYQVDCTYRIDSGRYDLLVREEYQEQPAISLTDQKNVMNDPGATMDRYSFVSNPFGNNSNAVYYVDDVVIATDTKVARKEFAAPGRRKLFVDLYNDYRKQLTARTVCLPITDLADLGMNAADACRLRDEGALEWLQRGLQNGPLKDVPNGLSPDTQRRLLAFASWKQGCAAAATGDGKGALQMFADAVRQAPEARIYEASAILALASQGQWAPVDERWTYSQVQWRNDIRFGFISALLGLARGNLDEAEMWLREPAEQGRAAVESAMIAEQYYYVLLWKGRYAEARDYAARVLQPLKQLRLPVAVWLERSGDAYFFERDYSGARRLYEQAVADDAKRTSAFLKLSDVWFQLGDREKERFYRERIYGVLK
jgi:tetratricopeptide (TPR) repeat protein